MDRPRAFGLGLAATCSILFVATPSASACSYGKYAEVTFVGTVTTIDPAGTALFHVDEVQSAQQVQWPSGLLSGEQVLLPIAAQDIVVDYRPSEGVSDLQSGVLYRVDAWHATYPDSNWESSTLAYFADEDDFCGSDRPAGTTYADGSPVEWRVKTFGRWFIAKDPRIKALTAAIALGAAGITYLIRRRLRRRGAVEPHGSFTGTEPEQAGLDAF